MSLDLYQSETAERVTKMPVTDTMTPGAFEGFIRGSGMYAAQGVVKLARGIDLLGSVGPIAQDAFTGGITAQTKYFDEHKDVFDSAMQTWTPKPNEVGVAGEVVGQLLGIIPQVIVSPGLAVAGQQLSTGEDLVNQGVSAGKANAVGAVQGLGLGLGIWLPILGTGLASRVLVGGAGANVVQGVATRAISSQILEGDKAAKQFDPFDGQALTLDVLLGMAFGGIAHLTPGQRAQGSEAWTKLENWAQTLDPSQKAAIATLREAQHMNVDSLPGVPINPEAIEAHVNKLNAAIDQLINTGTVKVDNMPKGEYAPKEASQNTINRIETPFSIRERVTDRLVETGMPKEQADANAAIWDSFFHATAKRAGVDANALYDRYVGGIKKGTEADLEDGLGQLIQGTEPDSIRKLGNDVLGREMAAAMPLESMDGGVLAMLKNDQVRRSVVSLLPVDVVNILAREHVTPEQFLGKPDVVFRTLSSDERGSVSVGVFNALRGVGTDLAAKLRSVLASGRDGEVLPTVRASDINPRSVALLLGGEATAHRGSGGAPKGSTSAGAAAEAAPVRDGLVGGGKDTPATLASLLDSHARIIGNKSLLKQDKSALRFDQLPDYARESIEMKGFYDKANIKDAELANVPWEKTTVPIESLRENNQAVNDGSDSKTTGPIVLNAEGAIVDGNHRFADAVRRGDTEIEVYRPLMQQNTSGTVRGFLNFDDATGKMDIGLLQHANASTFVHESGHMFLEITNELSKKIPEFEQDMQVLFKEWGVERKVWDAMTLDEKRPYHETFAKTFEAYLRDGKAPTEELRSVFERFKDWLTDVYKSLTDLGVNVSDEVRGLMDRMLGAEAAPVISRGSPSPPSGEKPARATAESRAADEYVARNPHKLLSIGTGPDGKPQLITVSDWLQGQRDAAQQTREDISLIEAAATCLLGRM